MAISIEDKTRLSQMEENLEKFGDKLDEILVALKGDPFGQHDGLVLEVKALKERMKKIEDIKAKAIWISIGASAAVGLTIDKVWDFIGKIIHHT